MKKFIYHKFNILPDLIPLSTYIGVTGEKIICPFYHTISDTPLPHLTNLYRVRNSAEFERDIDFLLKNYKPLSLQELVSLVGEKKVSEKPSFFLSFDDGLKEFHDIIAPILLKKGVPATCFLNSAFIDNKDMFYRYKAGLLMHELKANGMKILPVFKKWATEFFPGTASSIGLLLNINYKNKDLLDKLAREIGFDFNEFLKSDRPYLSTAQINSLIKKGFTFGSHSIDHPSFNHISADEQMRQITESTLEIVNRFHLSYKVFSFPFTDYGLDPNFFVNINKAVNFALTFGCAGIKSDYADNHIQRIPLEEYVLTASKRIKRDYFYYLLKMPFNKNRILRGS